MSGRSELTKYARNLGSVLSSFNESLSSVLMPPDDMEIDEWAEAHFDLSARVSARPGRISFADSPYQRYPLRALKRYDRVYMIAGAQVGKTIVLQVWVSYLPDQDPGPCMIVYPDMTTCRKRSKKHIQPCFQDSPYMRRLLTGDKNDFSLYEYNLKTMSITMAWAGSPAAVAGEPVKNLAMDEFGKYKDATKKEGASFDLALRRLIGFGKSARALGVTTPTVVDCNSYRVLEDGTWTTVAVKCPHCPEMNVIEFKSHFIYPRQDANENFADYLMRVQDETYVECEHCSGKIVDTDWPEMWKNREERHRRPDADIYSIRIPSWFSPKVKFGEVARRYVEALRYPDKMRDWENSDNAMPYIEVGENADLNRVKCHVLEYEPRTIPVSEVGYVIMTCDIHSASNLSQYFCVWYITKHRVIKLEDGTRPALDHLKELKSTRRYTTRDGNERAIDAVFCDVNHKPADIMLWAEQDSLVFPISGARIKDIVNNKTIKERADGSAYERPIGKFMINDNYWKEQLLLRFSSGFSEGDFDGQASNWWLDAGTSPAFLKQMLGESVYTVKDSKGFEVREWRSSGYNHYLDCAKYALAARWILEGKLNELEEEENRVDPMEQESVVRDAKVDELYR